MTTFISNLENPLQPALENPEYADLRNEIDAVSRFMAAMIAQGSFDDFIEKIESDFYPGASSPWEVEGEGHINLIPSFGNTTSSCSSTLLAVAKGRGSRNPFAFDNVMQGVKAHLIDCQKAVKLVVVATDTWDSTSFARKHAGELKAWRRRGVRFIFTGVGVPRNQIFPITVDLT